MKYMVKSLTTGALLATFDNAGDAHSFASKYDWETGWDSSVVTNENGGKDYSDYSAYALGNGIEITVKYMYECGWNIEAKVNGECRSDDWISSSVETMKQFKALAKQYEIKTVYVSEGYLDPEALAKWDRERAAYDREEAHFDACLLYESTGDRSALDRYERTYEEA